MANEVKPYGYWTYERCFEEAMKYKTRNDFYHGSRGAYRAATKNGWINNFEFEEVKKPSGYWDYSNCFEEAKKYTSRGEFYHKSQSAYKVAKKNGWIDDYTWFVVLYGKWTKETCYEEAKKYKTYMDFRNNGKGAFDCAARNGWIDDYTWLEKQRNPNGYWDYANCFEAAKKCTSRGEFSKKYPSAWRRAKQNNWIDDYTWFEKRRKCEKPIYVVYCYKDEETNSVYVGLTNNIETRHKQHCNGATKHGKTKYDTVYKYFSSIGKEIPTPIILKNNLLAKDAQYFEQYYVDLYKDAGMNIINIAKAGSIGGLGVWTRERIFEEAKNYNSRGEFWKKKNHLYNLACKNNWIDDYTWFKPSATGKKWTKETCYEEAKKYKTKKEFQKGNSRAYVLSYKNGWIDDYTWFEELKKPNGYWTREICYEEAKKYKSRSEFNENSSTAYAISKKNGWIDDYTWFVRPAPHNKKWNKESCFNEAIKCGSRTEFYHTNGTAYDVSRKNGWLDEFFPKKAA